MSKTFSFRGNISVFLSIIAYIAALIELSNALYVSTFFQMGNSSSSETLSLLIAVESFIGVVIFTIGSFFTLYAKLSTKQKGLVTLSTLVFVPNVLIILLGEVSISISTLAEQITGFTIEVVLVYLVYALYILFIGKKHWNAMKAIHHA